MKIRHASLSVALTVVVAAVAGCSSGDDKRSDDEYSVLNALAQIPSDDAFPDPVPGRTINTGDLRAATELAGLTWPEDLESREQT